MGRSCLWLNHAQPFIRYKEECSIFPVIQKWNLYGSAQCTAKVILAEWWLLHAKVVVKPIVGVESVVPQVVVGRAVPLIGARFGLKRKLAAGIASIFRRVSRTLDAKFLETIQRAQGLTRSQHRPHPHRPASPSP